VGIQALKRQKTTAERNEKQSTKKIFTIHVNRVLAAATKPCLEMEVDDIASLRLGSPPVLEALGCFSGESCFCACLATVAMED
jgi:hypothetical protein